jgi:putative phosphoesterase
MRAAEETATAASILGAVVVGLISDTHGLLRDRAVEALAGSDLIIHAGDVGRPEILDRLRAIAPVVAVRGNVDRGPWAEALPEMARVEADGARIYVLHDVHQIGAASNFDVVVSGHSHKPREEWRNRVLYVNPGSAGPRRFRLPIMLARLDLASRPWKVEFIEVDAG